MSNQRSATSASTNNNRPGFVPIRSHGGSGDAKNVNRHGRNSGGGGGGKQKKKWQMFGARRQEEGVTSIGLEVRQEWGKVQDELSDMERSVETGAQLLDSPSAITMRHWVKNSDCSACSNKQCKRTLWAMNKHHCRKCGSIFCAKCVQFRRRLSSNAEYDPNGWLYKVCEGCYGSKEQEMGHSRRWTYDLQLFRNARHNKDGSKLTKSVILRTCKNLVEGFQANYTSGSTAPQSELPSPSGPMNLFSKLRHGVTNVVKQGVPDWQKPQNWVSEGTSCQCCNKPYGKLDRQRNCRICGQLVCKAQSSKDMLLFTPDKSDQEELGVEPRWAVIRVIGCPEVEPDHRLYMRVCHPCREQLKEIQISEQQRLVQEGTLIHICWRELDQTYRDIMGIQTKIDASVPEFQKLIDGLEIQTGAPASLPPNRNNMQLLAKHQGDLSDHISVFIITVSRLKKLNPQTRTQVRLVQKLIECKFSYYTETNGLYRKLRKQLGDVAPQEVLNEIQSIVDRKVSSDE